MYGKEKKMAKTIDYDIKRGDTKYLNKFRVTDKDGTVLNLSPSDQLYFTMKNSNKQAVLKKKIGSGITLGDDGYYHITLESTDTEDLEVGTYMYDIELDLNLTKTFVNTIIEGEITLNEDVTLKGDRT